MEFERNCTNLIKYFLFIFTVSRLVNMTMPFNWWSISWKKVSRLWQSWSRKYWPTCITLLQTYVGRYVDKYIRVFILFYFILFYFILFYFILFLFISLYFILFDFILFSTILLESIWHSSFRWIHLIIIKLFWALINTTKPFSWLKVSKQRMIRLLHS